MKICYRTKIKYSGEKKNSKYTILCYRKSKTKTKKKKNIIKQEEKILSNADFDGHCNRKWEI